MRVRTVAVSLPALASAVVMLASGGASAASAGHVARPAPGRAPAAAAPAAAGRAAVPVPGRVPVVAPARRITDDVFSSDSCTVWPDNPSITSFCLTAGTWGEPGEVNGLPEASTNGKPWYITNSDGYESAGPITVPVALSCVPQPDTYPSCLAAGYAYKTGARLPTQLAENGDVNGFGLIATHNPAGATWSQLTEVSCVTATFCLLVGADGTTRRSGRSLIFLPHANAYRWNGTGLRRLPVPAPAHARTSDLASVSCPTATSCLAVGNYIPKAGRRSLPYSALWTGSSWRIKAARSIAGKGSTIFQAVSCAAAGTCVAVGDANAATKAFAERYSAGTWSAQRTVAGRGSVLLSVSCPEPAYCVAVGTHHARSLAETWNGSRWVIKTVPATTAPLTTDVLQHVSCVTASICAAVGFRHDPKSRFAYHTLALYWNGSAWRLVKSANQIG